MGVRKVCKSNVSVRYVVCVECLWCVFGVCVYGVCGVGVVWGRVMCANAVYVCCVCYEWVSGDIGK